MGRRAGRKKTRKWKIEQMEQYTQDGNRYFFFCSAREEQIDTAVCLVSQHRHPGECLRCERYIEGGQQI